MEAGALGGKWSGCYFYPRAQSEPIGFHLTVEPDAGRAFTGTIVEPNSFSEALVATLTARVQGTISEDGDIVRFVKRYDEEAGATHEVGYLGILANGGTLLGSWHIEGSEGSFAGPFVVHLGRPTTELPLLAPIGREPLTGQWRGITRPIVCQPGARIPITLELREAGGKVAGHVEGIDDDGVAHPVAELEGSTRRDGRMTVRTRAAGSEAHGWLEPGGRCLGGTWRDAEETDWIWVVTRAE